MAAFSKCITTTELFSPKDVAELEREIRRVGGNGNAAAIAAAKAIMGRAQEMRAMIMDAAGIEEPGIKASNRAQTDTPAFKKWFGDSKVVDENGDPLVVYHGTRQKFSEFSHFVRRRSGAMGTFSFSASPALASSYAQRRDGGSSPNVVPAYLSLQNPLVIDALGSNFGAVPAPFAGRAFNSKFGQDASFDEGDAISIDMLALLAKENGHDGLIVRNVQDAGRPSDWGEVSTTFMAFEPTQIKSAIGNSGEFDGTDPDITASNRAQTDDDWKNSPKVVLYRSADDTYIARGYSFSETKKAAQDYTTNPGFGGKNLYKVSVPTGNVLDLTSSKSPWKDLAKAASVDVDPDEFDGYISRAIPAKPSLADALADAGYDWVKVEDDFPAGSITWQVLSDRAEWAVSDILDPPQDDTDITASNRRVPIVGQSMTLPATTNFDAGRIKLQDDALRMRRVLESVKAQGGKVGEGQNFYDANTLMPGRIQAAMDDFRDDVVKPLIDKASKAKIEMDELALYAYAKHASERNDYIASINPRLPDGGSGMKTADAAAILQQVASSGKQADYDSLHADLMSITSTTRQLLLNEGLITQDEFDKMDQAYEFYIPLRGWENVVEETGAARPGVGRGVNIRGKETIRALGRTSRAGGLIENALRDYERAVSRVEKNDVGKVLLDFVLSNPDPDLWGVDVVKRRPAFNKAQGVVQFTNVVETGENTIGVKVAGEQVYIELADPALARALRQAWKDETSGLERATLAMTGWWNNWQRAVLTRYNPAFAAINLPRDALWSGTFSALDELGVKGLAKYALAFPAALVASGRSELGIPGNSATAKMYEQFRAAGGITGGFYMRSVEDIRKDLRRDLMMAGPKAKTYPIKAARFVMKSLEFLGSASENATRFALYAAAREVGRSPVQAALLAKNGTTNFNRKGEWGGALNNLYLFFNAGAQGTTQLAKVLKNPAVLSAMAGVAGVGAMLALYGASAGGDDEDGEAYWDKVPSYVKERNLVIMLPPGDALGDGITRIGKRGRYITVPAQYGFNIFPNMGYMTADVWRNSQNKARGLTPTKAALHMTSVVFGSINPFGGSVDLTDGVQVLLAAMPTLVDLPIQIVNERNTFGTPSSPTKYDSRPDSERMFTSLQGTAVQKVAKKVNELGGGNEAKTGKVMGVETSVSPGTIKTLVSATTGGLGSFVTQMADSIIALSSDTEDLRAKSMPVLNRFYGEVDEDASIRTAAERRREVGALIEEVKRQRKEGIEPELDAEANRLLDLAGLQERQQKELSRMRKEEVEIIRGDSTDAEKKVERKRIQADRDRLSIEFNREFLRGLAESE